MTAIAPPTIRAAVRRLAQPISTVGELALVRIALGVLALHVADDNLLQPNPGTTWVEHLTPGLGGVAALAVAAALVGRVRPGMRATLELLAGVVGLLLSTEALYYGFTVGLSGDDWTGLAAVVASGLLLGVGIRTLWSSRRRGDALPWRYARRTLRNPMHPTTQQLSNTSAVRSLSFPVRPRT